MRFSALILTALVLGACNKPAAPAGPPPVSDTDVQFLLASSAADFHAHPPEGTVRFREVRAVRRGTNQVLVCGKYLAGTDADGAPGTPFVTVKTSGYELYIGSQSEAAWCVGDSLAWNPGDLSATLQQQFDSLKGAGN
jgi:hypothetical protein